MKKSSYFNKFIHVDDLSNWELDTSMNFDTIIWDLDGTLYSIPRLVRKIQMSFFKKPSVLLEILNFKKTERLITKERVSHDFKLNEYEERFDKMQRFINSYLDESLILEESLLLLKKLKKLNKRQIIVSEYPIANKLEILNLADFFHHRHSSPEDIFCWKPNENMAKMLIEKYGLDKGFLLIGDRNDTDGILFKNILKELSLHEVASK